MKWLTQKLLVVSLVSMLLYGMAICKEKMSDSSINIKKEIVDYLVMINKERFPGLADAVRAIYNLKANELIADNDVLAFFYFLFEKNKYTLVTGIDN